MLKNAQFVDRLQQDFGTVLRFHAAKRLDPDFDFRREQAIGRIAKRGYRTLRNTVVAITNDQNDAALQYEFRMCLLVA